MVRQDYPIELIVDFDSDVVQISHGTGHPAGFYTYNIGELDQTTLDNLLGGSEEVVVYTQGESFTKDEFEAYFGIPLDMANLQRVHYGEDEF